MREWLTHNASDLVVLAAALGALKTWLHIAMRGLRSWIVTQVADPLATVAERVDKIEHRTAYHLGPNGGTVPLHVRVQSLEIVHSTAGVDPAEASATIASRQVGGRRKTDPQEGTP